MSYFSQVRLREDVDGAHAEELTPRGRSVFTLILSYPSLSISHISLLPNTLIPSLSSSYPSTFFPPYFSFSPPLFTRTNTAAATIRQAPELLEARSSLRLLLGG
jgi:hypothetical protein